MALFGDSVVPFELAGLRAGNVTQGHRLLGKSEIPVTIANFEQQLEANGVILSASKRRDKILAGIAELLSSKRLRVRPDPALLETLVYITEFPTPILGGFDSQYLELPSEVLVTVMRHHQKYFSVEDEAGNLAPHFIAVMNTDADPEGLVRHGNERVLRARFNDARFFWQQDQKKKLEERLEDLKNVTFQAKLGSYFEKTERVVALAGTIAEHARILGGWTVRRFKRPHDFAKCDLTTDMVKEFTELQGIVGGLYATATRANEATSLAIYEHYKPLSMEDDIPASNRRASCRSWPTRWDTLRECFRSRPRSNRLQRPVRPPPRRPRRGSDSALRADGALGSGFGLGTNDELWASSCATAIRILLPRCSRLRIRRSEAVLAVQS